MPLEIEDETIAALVTQLATIHGVSEQAAIRLAVEHEIDRVAEKMPLRDRFAALRAAHPLPPRTGRDADKAFFDELSGDL